MMRILIAFIFVCSACSSSVSNTKGSADSPSAIEPTSLRVDVDRDNPVRSTDKALLLGAWTDGSTENATFNVGKDSIFYLDEMTSFPYTMKGDSLTIFYPDMSFQGTAKFAGDTLILSDPEFGMTKYTRFKN
ncbi:hypothetical protein V9K67_05870 [Paraflavisolibacter sp. H34]|uniref:hypothetical protein n=1 Tax=Huijunlia imazamoxiresistens TaxID=3127457 RepID=UPI0030182E38